MVALAQDMAVPNVIASVQAGAAVLAQRLAQRSSRGNDASEADISVMQKLKVFQEPLGSRELSATVIFINNGDVAALRSDNEGWQSFDAHLA